MKNLLSTIVLLLTLGFNYSQVTETFDGVTISGGSFTTNSGLSFTTTDTFGSYSTNLQDGGVTMTAPIPRVYLDQSGSYFEITPTSDFKVFSSFSFDLWYSNSNFGTTLACECRSYDSYGNVLETLSKTVIAKRYIFSSIYGKLSKIRCNLTEINSQNAVFFDNITFSLVDKPINPFAYNSSNDLGIESVFSNSSTGNYSFSVGIDNTASGEISLATGGGTTASGFNATSFGSHTTASGGNSVAMGHYTKASDYASLAIGYFNDSGSTITGSSTVFDNSNTAFIIGNGADNDNRSDALVVKFDGTTTIAGDFNINSDKKVFFGNQSFIEGATEGTVLILNANNNILFRPGGTTTVNFEPNGDAIFNGDVKVTSDKRLKANIISLGSTLARLLQIDGKTYTLKKDENGKQKIGLLAQDIEKVFPELVSVSNGIKSVNYQGLVPVLINALKDQQSEIDELKSMVQELINKN